MTTAKQFSWTKKFRWDIIIAISVAILPFSIYLHLLFDQTDHSTINFIGLSFEHGFADSSTFVWSILVRIIPVFLLLIWFLVNSYWWRYFILGPISMNIYSLGKDCFNLTFFVQLNEDIFLVAIIITLITALFFCDRIFFVNYRNRNISDYKSIISYDKVLFKQIKIQLKKINTFEVHGIKYGSIARLLHLKGALGHEENYRIVSKGHNSLQFSIVHELVIILLLILITVLPYVSILIPDEKSTIRLIWFSIDDNGFNGMANYFWFMAMKVSILIALLVWFYTSRNWWRFALLSPIILIAFQTWEATQDIQQLDAFGNIKAFPAVFTVVIITIAISKVNKYRYGLLNMYDQIENELERFIEKEVQNQLQKYNNIRDLGNYVPKGEQQNSQRYLQKLYDLKDQIQYDLKANT